MRRIPLIAALITGLVLSSTIPAGAGAEVPPSAFKLVKGTLQSSTPLTELASDDDDYLTLTGEGANLVASFQLTFTEIPDLADPTQLRILHAAKGSPICSTKMWHWRKEKFIAVGEPFEVGSESELLITLENPGRFVRRDKARARFTCKDDVPYGVGFDLVRFLP